MKFLQDHPDVFKVGLLNVTAFFLTFTNIEGALKILALSITIGYGVWKWISEWKKENRLNKKKK
jgi:hypothetical protein